MMSRIDVVRILLVESEAHVGEEIGRGVPYGTDLLLRMDLLDDPTGVVLQELLGVYPTEQQRMEVRRCHPALLLLSPGMEYGDPCVGTVLLKGIADITVQLIELVIRLHQGLRHLLRR